MPLLDSPKTESLEQLEFPARRFTILVAAYAILVVSACGDRETPVGPSPDLPLLEEANAGADTLSIIRALNPPQSTGPGHTLRDEFSAMARRVPGGFGGVFFDRDGALTILLTDVTDSAEAKASLANERFIQSRTSAPGIQGFDIVAARIVLAAYDHSQLHEWLDSLLRNLPITPTVSGIRVHRNRILIGVESELQRREAENTVKELRIPVDAVILEVVPPARLLQTLNDRIRPVPAGVQIDFWDDGWTLCTIGPNVRRLGQRGFLVNSHCTSQRFELDYTQYWQPWHGPWHYIGNEAGDPPLFYCLENDNGCRNSDAAIGLYADYALDELGSIARPASRNQRDLTIDATNPRFQIMGAFRWAIDGEIMEKVGRTTGWSGGQVVDGCVTVTVDGGAYAIRCAMAVDAEAGGGDSGSPVFKIIFGALVELRGTLFAGLGECTWDLPDPVRPGVYVVRCPQFAASNLGGIEMDLDSLGTAPLSYW